MKKQNPQDERVVAERRKVNSEAYGILIISLAVSVLVQGYLLNAPFEQFAVEFICWIGVSFYTIARYIMLGQNIFGDGKRAKYMPLINSLVAGIVATAINGVLNYIKFAEHYNETSIGYFIPVLAITFVSVTTFTFIVLSCISYLNSKKQAKIFKRLEDDEQRD